LRGIVAITDLPAIQQVEVWESALGIGGTILTSVFLQPFWQSLFFFFLTEHLPVLSLP
jgi:hypothetical protein